MIFKEKLTNMKTEVLQPKSITEVIIMFRKVMNKICFLQNIGFSLNNFPQNQIFIKVIFFLLSNYSLFLDRKEK